MTYMTKSTECLCIIFEDLANGDGDPLISQWPRTSLISKFPCLLNLPRTNLECSAPFFGLSLSSAYKSICDPTAGSVGEQNLPLQMSLWHGDSFERENNQETKDSGSFSFQASPTPTPSWRKNLDKGAASRIELSPEIPAKTLWVATVGQPSIRVHSVSPCPCQTFAFLFSCQLLSSPLKAQIDTLNILFSL